MGQIAHSTTARRAGISSILAVADHRLGWLLPCDDGLDPALSAKAHRGVGQQRADHFNVYRQLPAAPRVPFTAEPRLAVDFPGTARLWLVTAGRSDRRYRLAVYGSQSLGTELGRMAGAGRKCRDNAVFMGQPVFQRQAMAAVGR